MSGSISSPALAPLGAGDIASLTFQNAGAARLQGGITTFGQSFVQGELRPGGSLVARIGDKLVPVQFDVKTTYTDGSVKMAVLSVERPDLMAGTKVDVVLARAPDGAVGTGPALDIGQAINAHSFVVELEVVGHAPQQIDVLAELQKALVSGAASFWQHGGLATQARVELPLQNSQRLVFDVTVYKDGGLSVDAMFNNDRAMEAVGGRVDFTAVARLDGAVVMRETVSQGQYQNWHREFSSNGLDGGQGLGSSTSGWLNIQHDVARLSKIGAVPEYDLTLDAPVTLLDRWTQQMAGDGWGDPLAANGILQTMGNAGGRPEIGILTQANSTWLLTQDARAAAYAMDQADVSGAVPWNYYSAATGTWLNPTDYPHLWMDGRGGVGTAGNLNATGPTQLADILSGWKPANSHQPEFSFVPYILTGERWLLDNLQAQAGYNLTSVWPYTRGADGFIIANQQVRASAWGMREIENALWSTPDGTPEKAWLQKASDANWKWLVSKIPEWTVMQGEAHGWLPGSYGVAGAMPPWQQDFFASTVISAASRGNADAMNYLNWAKNFLIGRFGAEEKGFSFFDGATNLLAISDPSTNRVYTTWAEIGLKTAAQNWSNGDGWSQSQGYYGRLAMSTLAGIYLLTGDEAAAQAYRSLAAESPPFTSADYFASESQFAVTIPGIYGGTVVGAEGNDTIILRNPAAKLNADLGTGADSLKLADGGNSGSIANAETITGGSGSENITLKGVIQDVHVDLSGGLDRLVLVSAELNSLTVSNTETIIGGVGADTITLGTTASNTTIDLGGGADRLVLLDSNTNMLTVAGAETVMGGSFTDRITVIGLTPALIRGEGGNDTLVGGDGADTLVGGVGRDLMTGGAGADRFVFTNAVESSVTTPDTITDFQVGTDKLVFAGLLTNSFTWRGAGTFTGAGNTEARLSGQTVQLDFDGNGVAEGAVFLSSSSPISLSGIDLVWI